MYRVELTIVIVKRHLEKEKKTEKKVPIPSQNEEARKRAGRVIFTAAPLWVEIV